VIPSSGTKSKQSCFCLVVLAYSSTMMSEAINFSETSVNLCQSTRRHIPQHSTPRNHRCKNLPPLSQLGRQVRVWPDLADVPVICVETSMRNRSTPMDNIQHSPASEADSGSANQEFRIFLWKPKGSVPAFIEPTM
jgi:hypothetical protein